MHFLPYACQVKLPWKSRRMFLTRCLTNDDLHCRNQVAQTIENVFLIFFQILCQGEFPFWGERLGEAAG